MELIGLRIGRQVRRNAKRLWAKRTAKAISKIELLKCLKEPSDIKVFLSNFRLRKEPLFFFDDEQLKLFKASFSEPQRIINDADNICNHNFDLLGSGTRNANTEEGKIDWHRDFKSGERWEPGVFFTDTCLIRSHGSDIMVPWELSRFQHLPTLGKAYWLTGNRKYVKEFVAEITDWLEGNPAEFGVNWTCTMDVAIRAVNWVWGYYFFKNSEEVTDEFLLRFLQSLLIHGRHIRANLERSSKGVEFLDSLLVRKQTILTSLKRGWKGITNNHYVSNIVGLVYLGIMLPEFKESQEWREFGIKELIKEMGKQVYPDGVDYEGSISYHRLEAELFLSPSLLCLKNNVVFPPWYMERLQRMVEFVKYYTKPDGTAPQIGDNDDGRLHILADYGHWDKRDHRHLLCVGASSFSRTDFRQTGSCLEEAFWLVGKKGCNKWHSLAEAKEDVPSKGFCDGGFYIMRKDTLYMIVDCLSNDHCAPSGHRHNSRLSFEMFAFDKTFIVDPGSYIYTADKEMRNIFRGTRYHNTVIVDGEEQNRFDENDFFYMKSEATTKVNKWIVTDEYDLLDAEHDGYKRLRYPVIHRRQIWFDKVDNYWVIRDTLTGEGIHQFDLYFHFAPIELEFDQDYPLAVRTKLEGANIIIIPLKREGVSVEMTDGWVSTSYGIKERAPIVKYSVKSATPGVFHYIIYPYEANMEVARIIQSRIPFGFKI